MCTRGKVAALGALFSSRSMPLCYVIKFIAFRNWEINYLETAGWLCFKLNSTVGGWFCILYSLYFCIVKDECLGIIIRASPASFIPWAWAAVGGGGGCTGCCCWCCWVFWAGLGSDLGSDLGLGGGGAYSSSSSSDFFMPFYCLLFHHFKTCPKRQVRAHQSIQQRFCIHR